MKRLLISILFKFLAVLVTVISCAPAAKLLNPFRKARDVTELDAIYYPADLLKAVIIALVGILVAYIILRFRKTLVSRTHKSS